MSAHADKQPVVLLTGASGFVGRFLQKRLQGEPVTVRTLQRPQHDLLQAATLTAPCQGIDTVYHLAAYAHVNQAQVKSLYATNVDGTANLLQAAIAAGVRRFVYVSSILADPAYDQPRTAYGDAKQRAETLLQATHAAGHIEVVILRPVNVYGPGMKGNLMTLLRLIRKGLMPPLPRFTQTFSLIGVEDLCQALLLAASCPVGSSAPVYLLTDGEVYQIRALEQAMRQALGKTQPAWATPRAVFYLAALALELLGRLLPINNAPGLRSYHALARNYTVDSKASQRDLGYNPQSDFYRELPAIIADMNGRGHE
ncbi:MAG: NAD-dependent epimerase/dehydratase family protein [Pseudohongiella sp.]|uniref:NAD-dependent epimerase/dehydratase family protein n=1 Tax=Pseudohongiella sp. TaxID=1979412 RepID=UPI0034A001D4